MSIAPITPAPMRYQPIAHEPGENEKRLHRRFDVKLTGRFMRASKQELACRVLDISVGGVALHLDRPAFPAMEINERIIAYIEHIGGLEGTVVRNFINGFAFKLSATSHKREKLAAKITWVLNEADIKGAAARQHERIKVANRDSALRLESGGFVPCLLLDVSLSGASIACVARPEIGEQVWLSGNRARVVRHHAEGIGVQFMETLDMPTLQAYFS